MIKVLPGKFCRAVVLTGGRAGSAQTLCPDGTVNGGCAFPHECDLVTCESRFD